MNVLGLSLFAILVLLVPTGAGAADEPSAPSSVSVWYAAGSSLARVNAESGQAVGSVRLSSTTSPVSSLAARPTDGSVAVLAKGRLLGFDASGKKTFEEGLQAASRLGNAPVLSSDPHDGSLWVGGAGVVVLSDTKGQNQRSWNLAQGEVVSAIVPSQGGDAWVLTASRLLRFSKEVGKEPVEVRKMPNGGLSSPVRMAVDEVGEFAYLANGAEVAQVDLKKQTGAPVRKIKPKGGVSALSVNPFDGTLYVSSRPSKKTGKAALYAYDEGTGALIKRASVKAKAIRSLSFDAPSQSLWLGTSSNVLSFQKDLRPKATPIGAKGLNALAAAPLSLSSHVSLLEPSNGSTIKDPKQPIKLGLKAYCNNEQCPEGFDYGKDLQLTATLDSEDVSSRFELQGDPASQGGAVATYTPSEDLSEGEHDLVARAEDRFGVGSNRLEASFTVSSLILTITEPEQGSTVNTDKIDVKGTVEGPEGTTVKVGRADATVDEGGNFLAQGVPLLEGDNSIVVKATAPDGKSAQKTLEIIYEPTVDPSDTTVRREAPPDSPVPTPGPLPPDPGEVAPAVEEGVATDTFESTRFLYEGANPIQTGVESGTIEDKRVAILKGKVANRLGDPVSGVRVTVLDYPELGQTLTREDGSYDMAVNGGGTVTLVYEKDQYMPAQRQVEAPWRDFANVDDMVLVGFSRRVTDVDLAATDEMQVARGSSISDEEGTRQATVLLPGDTQAKMVLSNGTEQALPEMDFRATEYTVGEDGPEAMPAELPPTSGYTYAVELSADEAVEAGAEEVRFTKPVYNYVENFLEFPVGEHVPNGYYDKEKGEWVPSEDGRVIKVLSITNGRADLDVDGGGTADDAATLQGLGITDEEREKLAGLYSAGQSLWRVPIDHFTPWDHNWPYGPPPDAAPPGGGGGDDGGDDGGGGGDENKPECEAGSIIDCQNQILGEDVNVSGAPFSLHYGSDGVPGRVTSRTLDIPLSGDTVPSSLKGIGLEVRVAGKTFRKGFPAQPNQSYTYTWDGKDAYGRTINGEQTVTYRVGYVYDLVYQASDQALRNSFAGLSGVPFTADQNQREITLWQNGEGKVTHWDGRGQGMGGWTPDILHQYDPEGRTLRLGNGDRQRGDGFSSMATAAGNGQVGNSGDGGPATNASLNQPQGVAVAPDGSLYVSTPLRVRKVAPDGTITTAAGTGSQATTSGAGDGGPATSAQLSNALGIAVGPDGSLYIADSITTSSSHHRVRKVDPDGIITTVAGSGQEGFSGDGGAATNAKLWGPSHVAVAPDGSLYINDSNNRRVRKVGTDGIITTVAGNGSQSFSCATSGPAKNVSLGNPQGIAVASDGSVYIADSDNHCVRKVGTDGIMRTVAGGGSPPDGLGDGKPAKDARLRFPQGVSVASDGTLYITDTSNVRIRMVSPDGIITTAAGNGQTTPAAGFLGDSRPPTDATLWNPKGIAVDPDGVLYIADNFNHRVRRIASPMPGVGTTEIVVPSEDGTELYHFDGKGKHLRTLDAYTGTVLLSFSYDSQGRLTKVEDMDGLTTTIERDASGNATAIVAPGGERTPLSLDANGYLASVASPVGETTRLAYDGAGGLLQSLTDPKNNTTTFTYDTLGRLTKDQDPAGGFKALSRTDGEGRNFTTSVTKASGRKDTYAVEKRPDGSSRRLNTDASGLKTEKILGSDRDEKVTAPGGTVVETSLGPDPRFGMQSPVADQTTIKTPGGRTKTTKTSRQATLSNPNDPLSATSITDKVQIGAREWASTFDKAAKTIKDTSPEGRGATTTVDAKGRPVLAESPKAAPESYEYDGRGRLAKITAVTGTETRTVTYAYDSKDRVSSMTDASGKVWGFEYDEAGRLARQIGPDNKSVSFSYDANGNLTSVTPPGKTAHGFAYDGRDIGTSYSAPQVGTEDRTTSLAVDLDRLPTSKTLPGVNNSIQHTYDAGGRPATTSYPGGQKSYTYDPTTGNGATASNANGTLTYAYDGSLPLSETSSGQVPGKVELKYDPDLRVSGVSVNGTEVTYSFDKDDLIKGAGSLTLTREAERGLVTGSTLSNVTDQTSHNAFGEPDSYAARSGTTQLYDTSYDERDSKGRIVEKTETVEGTSTTYAYSYDDKGRLIEVKQNGSVVASYAYDENGNRLSRTTSSGTTEGSYDAQDRLISYGENEYAYAPAGHLQTKTDTGTGDTTSYTHDGMGNLLSATLPDGKNVEYVVDARDRRVGKKVNGQLVQGFLYQGQLSPAAELDGSGNVVSRFVYATKGNVPDYMEKDAKTYRIITDQLGSVRLVVDASTGQVAQRLDYDEFGNVLNDTNPGFQPFGYAGGLYDRDTKLTRFGARDYDAETGRWIQKDPIGFEGGDANVYAYVSNDPINWIDPSGLFASVCVNGNDVHIYVPIDFSGPGNSRAVRDKALEGIETQWSGTFGKYKVRTHAYTKGSGHPGETNKVTILNGTGRSFVSGGGHTGTWYANDPNLGWMAAHEAGHLMGLGDHYTDVKQNGQTYGKPDKGWEWNMMGREGGLVTERNIEDLIKIHSKKKSDKCGCSK